MKGVLKLYKFHILHQTFNLLFTYLYNGFSYFIHWTINILGAQIVQDLGIESFVKMASVSFA